MAAARARKKKEIKPGEGVAGGAGPLSSAEGLFNPGSEKQRGYDVPGQDVRDAHQEWTRMSPGGVLLAVVSLMAYGQADVGKDQGWMKRVNA